MSARNMIRVAGVIRNTEVKYGREVRSAFHGRTEHIGFARNVELLSSGIRLRTAFHASSIHPRFTREWGVRHFAAAKSLRLRIRTSDTIIVCVVRARSLTAITLAQRCQTADAGAAACLQPAACDVS